MPPARGTAVPFFQLARPAWKSPSAGPKELFRFFNRPLALSLLAVPGLPWQVPRRGLTIFSSTKIGMTETGLGFTRVSDHVLRS